VRSLETSLRLSPASSPTKIQEANPARRPSAIQRGIVAGEIVDPSIRTILKPDPALHSYHHGDSPARRDTGFKLTEYTLDMTRRKKEVKTNLKPPTENIRRIRDVMGWTNPAIAGVLGITEFEAKAYLRSLHKDWLERKPALEKKLINVLGIVNCLEIMYPGNDKNEVADKATKAQRRAKLQEQDQRFKGKTLMQVLTSKEDLSEEVLGILQEATDELNGRVNKDGIEDDRTTEN
jgi:hypothetical protein